MNRFLAANFGSAMFTMALILIIIWSDRAEAQEVPCASTGVIEQQLADDHGESLRAEREAPVPGGMAYLWTNGMTGTYSVLINPEPGLTCIIEYGQSDRVKELEA